MKKLTLARSYLPNKTVGILFDNNIRLATLENPWLDNQVNISCIPEGSYLVKRDKVGRFQWYSITGVEGRTSIEMHGGNKVEDTDGCLLVAINHNDDFDLSRSIDGLKALAEYVGDNDCLLTVRAANKDDF